ncbi:hypothetical protein NPIL_493251 [Nephila pilipes]|uniref:Uncharacterized protein n=1 Tax=Nephila pilipes TaxID=299642 RepID=A0A8X6UTT5_NEPPI|nr:hypothetical protein NPIL_493251 [Nephila pilipes]
MMSPVQCVNMLLNFRNSFRHKWFAIVRISLDLMENNEINDQISVHALQKDIPELALMKIKREDFTRRYPADKGHWAPLEGRGISTASSHHPRIVGP